MTPARYDGLEDAPVLAQVEGDKEAWSAVFGYWYESYTLDDIVRNDVAVDYAAVGAIFLGALEPGYRYHVGSVRLVYSW